MIRVTCIYIWVRMASAFSPARFASRVFDLSPCIDYYVGTSSAHWFSHQNCCVGSCEGKLTFFCTDRTELALNYF